MPTEKELIAERVRKLGEIRALGIDPYPYRYEAKNTAKELKEKHAQLKPEEKTKIKARVAGRLTALRRMGKASFAQLNDKSGKIYTSYH